MMRSLPCAIVFCAASALAAAAAQPAFSPGPEFAERTGADLYAASCQVCHMADGKGATGAGRYPALAANSKLEDLGYPLTMVLEGHAGMPAVGAMMSDAQVAQVVNYVRSHFGNAYSDAVRPEDVTALRQRR